MKKFILIILTIFCIPVYGQNIKDSNENTNPANVYTSLSIGAIEVLEFEIGKYIGNNFSVHAYWSGFSVEGGILAMSGGFGLGGSYYFNESFIFRHTTFGVQYLYGNGYEGFSTKMTFGNRSNIERGISFLYELGVGYSKVKGFLSQYPETHILLGPILKIGINYNF